MRQIESELKKKLSKDLRGMLLGFDVILVTRGICGIKSFQHEGNGGLIFMYDLKGSLGVKCFIQVHA